jgi:Na+/proline symporter
MSERNFISAGWWGYFICAVIYVIGGIRAGDWITILGSLFFLIATISFMVPHYRAHKDKTNDGLADAKTNGDKT